jgi:DNA-binding MarR family transcriptional regulator
MPCDDDSVAQISHGLSVLLRRDTQRRILEIVAARAGVDLGPAACWTLAQIDRDPDSTPGELARTHSVDPARLLAAFGELKARGMIEKSGADPASPPRHALTPAGRDAFRRLDDARRERVAELLADWSPDQHRQVAELLRRYASDVPDEAPAADSSSTAS